MGRRTQGRGAGQCPSCRAAIEFRNVSPAQRHQATVPLYIGGAVVAVIWAAFLMKSEFLVVPRNLRASRSSD